MAGKRKYIILTGLIALTIVGYFIVDNLLFTGTKAKTINENGFQASYFAKDDTKNETAVVLIGGGQWGDYWAQEFAAKGMVGLSMPYTGRVGLPRLPEEIELEYFENALNWLKGQAAVDSNKIVLMGASRNAELALIIASIFPKIVSGVVAYAPSSVSWSNTVLPYNSNELKSSWTYKGHDIPYIPMDKIKGNDSGEIEMIDYWKGGLAKTDFLKEASIKVENINGPILLFSGNDDKVWPSAMMADMIAERLENHGFMHAFNNVKYDNAGHSISNKPDDSSTYRTGTIEINGKKYQYDFGGNSEGDLKAKQDAKRRLMEFLEKI